MKKNLYSSLILVTLFFSQCQKNELASLQEKYGTLDLIIYGGLVTDGSGAPAQRADVAIAQNTIVYIEEIDTLQWPAKRVIHAEGKTVSPGFTGTRTHGDPLRTPDFENFLPCISPPSPLGKMGSVPIIPILAIGWNWSGRKLSTQTW